jgi:hypothetical protein
MRRRYQESRIVVLKEERSEMERAVVNRRKSLPVIGCAQGVKVEEKVVEKENPRLRWVGRYSMPMVKRVVVEDEDKLPGVVNRRSAATVAKRSGGPGWRSREGLVKAQSGVGVGCSEADGLVKGRGGLESLAKGRSGLEGFVKAKGGVRGLAEKFGGESADDEISRRLEYSTNGCDVVRNRRNLPRLRRLSRIPVEKCAGPKQY